MNFALRLIQRMDVRLEPKVGQISNYWDKSGTLKISKFSTFWQSDLIKPRILSYLLPANLTLFRPEFDTTVEEREKCMSGNYVWATDID